MNALRLITPLTIALLATSGTGQAQGVATERYAEVVGMRLELQETLRQRLQQAVTPVARPYEVSALVNIAMRAEVHKIVDRETREGMDLKLGSTEEVKLPGLPAVRGPSTGAGSPNVTLKLPGQTSEQVRDQIKAMVDKMTVRLWIESGMPAEQIEQVKKIAIEVSAIDEARGDTLEILEMARNQVLGTGSATPAVVAQRTVIIFSATLLICAIILALALRASRKMETTSVGHLTAEGAHGEAGGGGNGVDAEGAPGLLSAATASGEGARERRFTFLAEAAGADLLSVLTRVKPRTAAAILDQIPTHPDVVAQLFKKLDDAKKVALVGALAKTEVLDVGAIEQLEDEARAVYEDVMRKVALGSTSRAADLLAGVGQDDVRAVLEGLGARDPELVESIRKGMLLFEDLPGLELEELRAVIAGLDPALVVIALQGADAALRDKVMGSVSKRLQAILQSEAELTKEQPPETVEQARLQVERVMRRVRAQRSRPKFGGLEAS